MTKFILHGGGEMERNRDHDRFFQEFINNLPQKARVLLVYFAVPDELVKEKHPIYEEYFQENNLNNRDLELRIATKDNFLEELAWADGVYFRGGETELLLKQMESYPSFKEEILKKRLVAGSSAGVYFLSNYAFSKTKEKMYKGLGVLPIKTNCHYLDDRSKIEKALKDYPGELLVLGEGEYKIWEK